MLHALRMVQPSRHDGPRIGFSYLIQQGTGSRKRHWQALRGRATGRKQDTLLAHQPAQVYKLCILFRTRRRIACALNANWKRMDHALPRKIRAHHLARQLRVSNEVAYAGWRVSRSHLDQLSSAAPQLLTVTARVTIRREAGHTQGP